MTKYKFKDIEEPYKMLYSFYVESFNIQDDSKVNVSMQLDNSKEVNTTVNRSQERKENTNSSKYTS